MPKVSVIILTYNRAHFLRSAIASVLNQTFQDFEIIVIDDTSTDNTRQVVSDIHDKRIRYICHETNEGEAYGRNNGVTNSNGEYIAFLDDDDEWMPEKLRMQVDILEGSSPEVGCVHTAGLGIDKTSGKIWNLEVPERRGYLFEELLIDNFMITSSVFLRNICFQKVGVFDTSIPYGNDWDMWIRISKHFQFEYINKPLVRYCYHDHKLTTNFELVAAGFERLLEKHRQSFCLNRKGFSQYHRKLGVFYCLMGDTGTGKKRLLKAIKLYPFGIKPYVALCLCALGADKLRKLIEAKEQFCSKIQGSHRFLSSGDEVYRR